jgi:hypothetical protein
MLNMSLRLIVLANISNAPLAVNLLFGSLLQASKLMGSA